jgi:cytochrome b561
MSARPTQTTQEVRYSRIAIWLHWLIALFILFNLSLGFVMEGLPPPARFIVVLGHISAGITVLALTIVRIAWRLANPPPPFADGVSGWERKLAHAVHFGLYALMLAMPLLGWALISANPPKGSPAALELVRQHQAAEAAGTAKGPPPFTSSTVRIWGIVPVPPIAPISAIGSRMSGVERQKQLHDGLVQAHALGAIVLLALLALHLGGVVKHQFIDRQDQLHRMGIKLFRRA